MVLDLAGERLFGYAREGLTVEAMEPESFRNIYKRDRDGYPDNALTRPMASGITVISLAREPGKWTCSTFTLPLDRQT